VDVSKLKRLYSISGDGLVLTVKSMDEKRVGEQFTEAFRFFGLFVISGLYISRYLDLFKNSMNMTFSLELIDLFQVRIFSSHLLGIDWA
jgi:hypothetical protein